MANNNNIKNVIRNNIYNNTKQEISGNRLRDVLLAMVNSLTAGGYIFKGVMSPSSEIETPDERVFYFSSTAGNYPVGEIEISASEFAVIYFDTTWHKEVLAVPTSASLAAEVLARTNADTAEATTRATADAALGQRIDNISAIGRFLSVWNCSTGLPATNPTTSPYAYHTGDYYLVGVVGGSNFKPSGSQYVIGEASTAVESDAVAVGDVYMYDGSTWKLLANSARAVLFSQLQGSPMDNAALAAAFNAKANSVDVYTKTAADALLNTKANAADVYTKIAADALLAAKANTTDVTALGGRVTTIEGKIPAQATSANQLADKDFVNSSIATNTATFRGTFDISTGNSGYVYLQCVDSDQSYTNKPVLGSLGNYATHNPEEVEQAPLLLSYTKGATSAQDTFTLTQGSKVWHSGAWGTAIGYFPVGEYGHVSPSECTLDEQIDGNGKRYFAISASDIRDTLGWANLSLSEENKLYVHDFISWNSTATVADKNDYIYEITGTGPTYPVARWKFNNGWWYEYSLNNTGYTAAQLSALNSGITSSKVAQIHDEEVFIAEYGETTSVDIDAAVEEGKVVFAKNSSVWLPLVYNGGDWHYFGGCDKDGNVRLWYVGDSDWEETIITPERSSNKETTLAGFETNKTSTSKYPSNKAIADYIAQEIAAHHDSTKEDTANKTSDIAGNASSTTKFATTKGVADYVGAIVGNIGTILDEINGVEI